MTPARPGRPRDAAAEQAILEAVVELLREHGFARLTMGEVAAKAGVGKPTIYRRWPSKAELVVDAIVRLAPPIHARRSGDPQTDVRRLIRVTITELTSPPLGPTVISLLADMHTSPQLQPLIRDRLVGPRRGVVKEVLDGAIATGQLRPDTDPDLMLDLLLGPLLYRWLTTGEALSRRAIDRIVDTVWALYAA
ncbi:MAG TPA: TetR/AcrR family transcriptional regulator [Mycobacteriales bacterium]|nr:TetR/AcrR family transcriptional regulator [Mycobacteriales bacterium]